MRLRRNSFVILSLFTSLVMAQSQVAPRPRYHHYSEVLTLQSGSSPRCVTIFGGSTLQGKFSYYQIKNIFQEDATALLLDASYNISPIYSELYAQGESDRLAFAHYYQPVRPYYVKGKGMVGLYSIILNICPDHTVQAGVQFSLPPNGESCLFATSMWNYCR